MRSFEIQWFAVDNPPGYNHPEWIRTAGIDDCGRVLVPAIIGGDEQLIYLSIGFDGAPHAMLDGHLFVLSEWLRKECPHTSEVLEKIESNVRKWDYANQLEA